MPFLESVEEGLEMAQQLLENSAGEELDPQNEQDKDECEAEGAQDNPRFALSDPSNLDNQVTESSTGLFKTVELCAEEQLEELTKSLDDDQLLALSKVMNYSRLIKISRARPTHPNSTTRSIKAKLLLF